MPGRDPLLAAHPVEIYRAVDTMFADEPWLAWEPETLLLALDEDVSEAAQDKLLAVQAVAANPLPVLRFGVALEKTVNAFCNNICVMDAHQPPYVEELVYAVKQIRALIRAVRGRNIDIQFDGETPGYVAGAAKFRDWIVLPQPLAFAQAALDSLTGLAPRTDLRREHARIIECVTRLCRTLTVPDAEKILHSPEIASLAADDSDSLLVKRVIGAMLYDPTLPYAP